MPELAGNLHVDPRAAIVAIDYSSGDVLQLSGSCQILWDQHDLPGAERTLQFTTQAWSFAPRGIPVLPPDEAVGYSPYNPVMEHRPHGTAAAEVLPKSGMLAKGACSRAGTRLILCSRCTGIGDEEPPAVQQACGPT